MIRGDVQDAALPRDASPLSWRRLCELLCDPTLPPSQRRAEVAWLRRELRAWPEEVSRPLPTLKVVERLHGKLPADRMPAFFEAVDDVRGQLCRVVKEVDLYPLYVERVCTSPLLRLGDGTQAVHLARAFTGQLAERRIGQAGQGDLVGGLCIEWWCDKFNSRWAQERNAGAGAALHRLDVRLEVEVKMDDGEMEDSQLARQKFFARRGGVYVVPVRIAQCVEMIAAERDRIVAELTS